MNFLQAVNATLRACSESETAVAVAAVQGTTEAKFAEFVQEAHRIASTMRNWPWDKAMFTVTAGVSADMFVMPPTLREVISFSYAGVRLSDRYTYEDLLSQAVQMGNLTGAPTHFAMVGYDTAVVYPKPTDVAPETQVSVYGYATQPDFTLDTDVLPGPSQYHDAVVQLAYSIAKDKHFGSPSEAGTARRYADGLFKILFARSRRNKAAPRIRV